MRAPLALLLLLLGCSGSDARRAAEATPPEGDASESSRAETAPRTEGSQCLGLGPAMCVSDDVDVGQDASVAGGPLASCSTSPMTGFFRTGRCETGPGDRGVHVVCAEVTEDFLESSRRRGNDLITPRPGLGFAGLTPGDRWCLCAARWAQALDEGVAPPVVLEATHRRALDFVPRETLAAHSASAP